MGAMQRTVALGAVTFGLLLMVGGPLIASPPAVAGAASATPVAQTTMTFVDTSRATPAWDGMPAKASRTLVTTIWYPAQRSGSAAASGGSPYPLIVFAHGLGGSPQQYQQLLTAWAAAGYVVAAPLFPLSNNETPGGPDGGDIGNQPGDMSLVIDQVLKASAAASGPLSGLVDPNEIGAAGHSNGGIDLTPSGGSTTCASPLAHHGGLKGGWAQCNTESTPLTRSSASSGRPTSSWPRGWTWPAWPSTLRSPSRPTTAGGTATGA